MIRTTLAMLLMSAPSTAFACGGLFCNSVPGTPGPPVVQNAERIAFGVDGSTIEAHVQIFYEGDPIDFAWVVPVPSEPELLLGSDALFDVLADQTRPQFIVEFAEEGRCTPRQPVRLGCAADFALSADTDRGGIVDTGNGVDIIDESQVGPFETVTLKADSATQLLDWLQDNNYELPDDLDPILAPYVAGNSYFVALRLQNDRDTGDIEPIVMRYQGEKGMIPVQLTAIAAADDMPFEVYVFGGSRAVPENYLHVVPNPAAIDWLSAGSNYGEVVTRAVDAAGGKAFVTDFAGSPAYMQGEVARVASVMAVEAGETLSTEQLEAVNRAEELLEYGMLTRLSTSMSATDMDLDPLFVFNPDLPNVSRTQTATVTWDCRGKRVYADAYRTIELPDGQVMLMPSNNDLPDPIEDPDDTGFNFGFQYQDSAAYLAAYDVPAMRIERTGNSGEPSVEADNTEAAADVLKAHNEDVVQLIRAGVGPGPGCAMSPQSGGLAVGWMVILLASIRRRQG